MRSLHLTVIFTAIVGVATGVTLLGQDQTGTNAEKGVAATGGPATAAATALQLADYGRQQKSPLALLAAAEILINAPTQPGQFTEPTETPIEGVQSEPGSRDATRRAPTIDPAALLKEARDLAGGNQELLTVIARLESRAQERPRGDVTGPNRAYYRVRAFRTNVHRITFRGAELAEVCISGDGDTDLDLYVYDQNSNLIVSSDSYGDDECVAFRPRWTAAFRLEVRNLGRVFNDYLFLTN